MQADLKCEHALGIVCMLQFRDGQVKHRMPYCSAVQSSQPASMPWDVPTRLPRTFSRVISKPFKTLWWKVWTIFNKTSQPPTYHNSILFLACTGFSWRFSQMKGRPFWDDLLVCETNQHMLRLAIKASWACLFWSTLLPAVHWSRPIPCGFSEPTSWGVTGPKPKAMLPSHFYD